MEDYIRTVDVNGNRDQGYHFSVNQMMWDFGLPAGQFNNLSAINELVRKF